MKLRTCILDAGRYWERRRLLFNAILAIVTIIVTYEELAQVQFEPTRQFFGLLVVMAIFTGVANLCYCTAYLPDVAFQMSRFANTWKRFRWILFSFGTVLASVLVMAVFRLPHG